jgi:hypothetical protein
MGDLSVTTQRHLDTTETARSDAVREAHEFLARLKVIADDVDGVTPRTRIEAISVAHRWARERSELLGLHRPRVVMPAIEDLYREVCEREAALGVDFGSDPDGWDRVMRRLLPATTYAEKRTNRELLEDRYRNAGTTLVT